MPRSPNLRLWNSLVFLVASPLFAHDAITTKLTWTQEISRLVYRHCAGCHQEGGTAFSLTTYNDARPWAKAIRDEVLGRRMPPWGPVKGVDEFHGDPSLSLPEIDMFVAWVEGGAPEGDLALLPSRLPGPLPASPAVVARKKLEVFGELTLPGSVSVLGLRPRGLQDRQSLEAWATKPNGEIERLIWLKDYRVAWLRDYRLLRPVHLQRGTRIHVTAPAGASLVLLAE